MTIKRIPSFVADASTLPQAQALAEASGGTRSQRHRSLNAQDGTRQLLVSGSWTMLVAAIAAALLLWAFGGVGPEGAHSNAGWLALMVSMMSAPFAILLLLLGGAKWLRNLRLSRDPEPPSQR